MRNYCHFCGYKFRYKYQKISPCCARKEKVYCVKTGKKLMEPDGYITNELGVRIVKWRMIE